MFQIPNSVLSDLKCHICDGYLNCAPVLVSNNDSNQRQICGKCYKLLPSSEQENYARQISYETIAAACVIFPCRYHSVGCSFMFKWNHGNHHEVKCRYRFSMFPDLIKMNNNKQTRQQFTEEHEENPNLLLMNENQPLLPTDNNETANTSHNNNNTPIYESIVYPSSRNSLNSRTNNNDPSSVSNSISAPTTTMKKCFHCNGTIVNDNCATLCLFDHVIHQKTNQGDMCSACIKYFDCSSSSSSAAATAKTPLLTHVASDNVFQNSNDGKKELCQNNDKEISTNIISQTQDVVACLIEGCSGRFTWKNLQEHLKEMHSNEVIIKNKLRGQLTNKDQTMVFLCHNSIFKCSIFNYNSFVEITIAFLGECDKANNFSLDITIKVNDNKIIKRKSICSNWNDWMLAEGVNLGRENDLLLMKNESEFNFPINLTIISSKND